MSAYSLCPRCDRPQRLDAATRQWVHVATGDANCPKETP